MFEIDYRVVYSEFDDFKGQNGFFQIKCNGYIYGEMYPEELEVIMNKVSLYDWFERLARTIKNLITKDYVALSDVESYNTWIVFQKSNEEIKISILKAKKEQGSHDIEFSLNEVEAGEWSNQVVDFCQLKQEVLEKGKEYLRSILSTNEENILFDKIKREFDDIELVTI